MFRRCVKIGQAAYGEPNNYEEVDYRFPVFGPSVADRSYFHPDSAVLRSATLGVPPDTAYTFPDGEDDGRAMPPYSRKDCDLVELTAYAKEQRETFDKQVRKYKKRKEYEKYVAESKALQQQNQVKEPDNVV